MKDMRLKNARFLAGLIYEGSFFNLAEEMSRTCGKASAISFLSLMDEDVQNFWLLIAQLLINHAAEWEENNGSFCVLSEKGKNYLAQLPRWRDEIQLAIIAMDAQKAAEAVDATMEEK